MIILLVIFLYLVFGRIRRRPLHFPPGPAGYPVVGNLLQLGLQVYETAVKLRPKYGDIQGFRLGSSWWVILNDIDDANEAFSKPEFSARTGYNGVLDVMAEDVHHGVIMSSGSKWLQHRRFSLKALKDLGFGKRTSEAIIMEEVNALVGHFQKSAGRPFINRSQFNIAAFNVIWMILAGQRHDLDDRRMQKLMEVLDEFFHNFFSGLTILQTLYPWIYSFRKTFPWFPLGYKGSEELRREAFQYFREVIHEHRKTFIKGEPRDYIDKFIEAGEDLEEMNLLVSLLDFFVAGTETVTSFLDWSLFLLALYPQVQDKMAKEILQIPSDRRIGLSDRQFLPYTEAVLQEIHRFSSVSPMGTPHGTTEDVIFKGFYIPKDTFVFINLYAVHFDKGIWGDPENFRPERFLPSSSNSGNGGLKQLTKALIPFGIGKRSCVGQSLARDKLFLFVTNLVQTFRVTFPRDERRHTGEGVFTGLTRNPPNHRIVLYKRSDLEWC